MNKSCVCVAMNASTGIWAKPTVLGPEKRFSIEDANWQHVTDCSRKLHCVKCWTGLKIWWTRT